MKRIKKMRHGFTLVELLVVIAIIGVLAGLIIPAVFAVQASFTRSRIKFEVTALAEAVEKYRAKYGDYPPDGSSWPIMEAHLRKITGGEILQSELDLLNPTFYSTMQSGPVADIRNDNDTRFSAVTPVFMRVMDPAEALVFFLGGFSSDKQRPFTGVGGPFAVVPGANGGQTLQYNGSRQNSFFEFPVARLTLATVPAGSSTALVSSDEFKFNESPCQSTHGGGPWNDLLPVFMSMGTDFESGSPYVYFDSRTYLSTKPIGNYVNNYQPSNVATGDAGGRGGAAGAAGGVYFGAAYPFLSEQVNTAIASPSPLLFEQKDSFQILSPGSDGRYGGRIATDVASSGLVLFTSRGASCAAGATGFFKTPVQNGPFVLPEHMVGNTVKHRPAQDNSGNFIEPNTFGENINF